MYVGVRAGLWGSVRVRGGPCGPRGCRLLPAAQVCITRAAEAQPPGAVVFRGRPFVWQPAAVRGHGGLTVA